MIWWKLSWLILVVLYPQISKRILVQHWASHARMTQGSLTGLVNKYRTARTKAGNNKKRRFACPQMMRKNALQSKTHIQKSNKTNSFFQEGKFHQIFLHDFSQLLSRFFSRFLPPIFFGGAESTNPGRATGEAGRCRAPGEEIFWGSSTRSHPKMHTGRRIHGKGGASGSQWVPVGCKDFGFFCFGFFFLREFGKVEDAAWGIKEIGLYWRNWIVHDEHSKLEIFECTCCEGSGVFKM